VTAIRWRTVTAAIFGFCLGLAFAGWAGELGETIWSGVGL
jgi:hypothetical protein